MKTDLALGIIIAFVLVILYQVERTRLEAKAAAAEAGEAGAG